MDCSSEATTKYSLHRIDNASPAVLKQLCKIIYSFQLCYIIFINYICIYLILHSSVLNKIKSIFKGRIKYYITRELKNKLT